jgi:hypothetical protein
MRETAIIVAMLAVGCVEEPSEPRACNPVISVDDVHTDEAPLLETGYEGASYCMRVDTSAMSRPHLELSSPYLDGFVLELRDLDNEVFATSDDIPVGSGSYSAVQWDPAGGESYDVLVHLRPLPPVISGSVRVSAQLTIRP